MSDYNANFHHRKSMRLKGYDYSKSGFYALTICIQDRECLLGKIESQKMILNDAGQMVVKWYTELENKYPEIQCHEMVIMPNHFHCIIQIDGNDADIPSDIPIRVQHNDDAHTQRDDTSIRLDTDLYISSDAHAGAPLRGRPIRNSQTIDNPYSDNQPNYGHDNKKYHATLGYIVDWFKTMTTNEYIRGVKNLGWKRFDDKLWQRNYWDDIVRSDESLDRIAEYILHNPERWEEDLLNPECWKDISLE